MLKTETAAVERIVTFFETLTPTSVAQINTFYTADARFKDPFNEVSGTQAIEGIFAHMFKSLHEPRFVVTQQVVQPQPDGSIQCVLMWDFLFRFKRFDVLTLQTVKGCSHLAITASGAIALHRDYWDAAEELYEKLPVVGALMRWLKKRANT